MKTNTQALDKLNLHAMWVSKPVNKVIKYWGNKLKIPNACILDQLTRFGVEHGFEPTREDTRNDPINKPSTNRI